jgi:hypothetical protein
VTEAGVSQPASRHRKKPAIASDNAASSRETAAISSHHVLLPHGSSGGVVTVTMALHLVIGLAFATFGVAFLLRRRSLARDEAGRGRVAMGPAGWTVLGSILVLAGVLQIATAFA